MEAGRFAALRSLECALVDAPNQNPFRPGTGKYPPYLAGRGEEKKALQDFLARTKKGDSPDRPCVVHGPRGNGKTALLRWLKGQCEKNKIECLLTNPRSARTLDQIAQELIPPKRFRSLIPASARVRARGFELEWRLRGRERLFQNALMERCKRKPVAFLLDEAHVMDPDVLGTLLNAAQHVQGEEHPFMLVLAGTPRLRQTLNQAGASFWERAKKLLLLRLERAHSKKALTEPFGPCLQLDGEEALDQALREIQDYPFFIQLMGSYLWNADRRAISPSSLQSALPRFEKEKNDYCLERQIELDGENAIPQAAAVATLFKAAQKARLFEVKERAGGKFETLRDLGLFIVRAGNPETPGEAAGDMICEPGIPSLMDHLRQGHERNQRQKKGGPSLL